MWPFHWKNNFQESGIKATEWKIKFIRTRHGKTPCIVNYISKFV